MTSPLHGLRMLLAAAVLPAALAAAGCGPSYELVTRTRADKPESRSFPSKHHTLEIAETPSASSPEIVVRVQQQWFSLERRKKIEQQFKKFDEKTFEAVAGTQKETFFGRISDQQEWRPAGGVNVTFRVASAGKEVQAQTDDSGLARFSVSEFAEEWIEGRDLVVEVKASFTALEDPNVWAAIQNKVAELPKVMATVKEALKVKDVEFSEALYVRANTLEAMFEKR